MTRFALSPELTARLKPYLRRHKSVFFELFACGTLVNFFALGLPLFSSYVYDKVLGNGITSTMWALAIAMGLIIVIEWSVRTIRVLLAEKFSRSSERDIDRHIILGLFATKVSALPPIGRVIDKYKQLLYYRDFLSSTYILALADVPFLALFLLAIFIAAGPLVFVSLTMGFLLLVAQVALLPTALEYEAKSRHAGEKRLEQVADMLASREAVLGSHMQSALTRHWNRFSAQAAKTGSKARIWRGIAQSIGNSLGYLSYVGVLVGGVYMVEEHVLTSGGLLAASMLSSRVMGGFASVAMLVVRYHEFKRAIEEMGEILPEPEAKPGEAEIMAPPSPRGRLLGRIAFQQVTCHLPGAGQPVLQDVSLVIEPGEMVGIAGMPGAGKTTLLRLISGLLLPNSGEVLIDHVPVRTLHPEDVSVNLGYKPQDLSLMEGSIEENICAGRATLTAQQRSELLAASGLQYSFDQQGLNWTTQVGPRGSHLSGGQRQMVALARAFLGSPTVMLLDEPTTGLDHTLEQHIADQLAARRNTATILISTHSRSLLSICDRIIVVGNGRILANGPREKVLMAA